MQIQSETLYKIIDQCNSIIILFGRKSKSEPFWDIMLFLFHRLITPICCPSFGAIHQFHEFFVLLFLLFLVHLRVSVQNLEIMVQMSIRSIIFLIFLIVGTLYGD